jgi:hypothetical protein
LSNRWAVSLIFSVYVDISGYLGRFFNEALVGAQGFDLGRYFVDNRNKLGGFGRRDPGEVDAVRFDPHVFEQVFHQDEFATCVVITFQVMAFARMSAGYPDRVGAFAQGGQGELGTHAPGAGNAHDADIGRILHAADTGQIRGSVAAPITKKTDDFGFPFAHIFNSV